MTAEELDQIEARRNAADPGPWQTEETLYFLALCAEVRRLQAENAELAAIAVVTGAAATSGLKIDPATIPGAIEHYKENNR